MTKKRILFGFLGLIVLYLCYLAYIFILSPKTNLQSIYLIPKDAVFIIESEQPVESWEQISKSEGWRHLKKNAYFSDLTENIQRVDTIFNNNHKLFEFFDNRSLFISIHMISPKDYGIFYVLDLKRIAKLQLLKTYLNTLLDDGYVLSKRTYHEQEILEVHDRESKETMYLAFIKNQLVASYTHTLVEASIDQYMEPVLGRNLNFLEINQKVGHEDLFRMYVQYHYFDDYVQMYSDRPSDWVKRVSENFLFSGFYFDLDENSTLTANGYTNISGVNEYYLEALQKSGTAKRSVPEVAPNSTALYISYGFDSFAEFYKNFESVQQNDPEQFESYQTSIAKMEKFLKIDIKEHFVSWIGDEIAVLQIQSHINKGKNDVALVLKANDAEAAKTNLDFVVEQIRKKTPVKFKAVNYKDYEINFLSIKGFFKMLLGGRFDEFDKPYFTQIDDFVIFSDSPNTLKGIIDKVSEGDILATSEEFKSFDERFDSESSVFVYSNVPLLFDNMYALADAPTKQKMLKNKDFIICFPQVGLQLSPEDDLFESRLVLNYRNVDEVKRTFKTSTSVNKAIPKKQASASTEITDAVFDLKPIYPTDLNAKSFRKQYTNGNTRFEVDLKDGLKHGRYEEFYPDGTRKIRGRFRDDVQVGTWRYYDKNGEQVHKKRF
ncbi:toxin-antitoxin system YwqK family antitoxin [Flagellimonas marinaquae]